MNKKNMLYIKLSLRYPFTLRFVTSENFTILKGFNLIQKFSNKHILKFIQKLTDK